MRIFKLKVVAITFLLAFLLQTQAQSQNVNDKPATESANKEPSTTNQNTTYKRSHWAIFANIGPILGFIQDEPSSGSPSITDVFIGPGASIGGQLFFLDPCATHQSTCVDAALFFSLSNVHYFNSFTVNTVLINLGITGSIYFGSQRWIAATFQIMGGYRYSNRLDNTALYGFGAGLGIGALVDLRAKVKGLHVYLRIEHWASSKSTYFPVGVLYRF